MTTIKQPAQHYCYYFNKRKNYINILAYIKNGQIFINIFNYIYTPFYGHYFQLEKNFIYKYNKKSAKYYIIKALKNIKLKDINKLELVCKNLPIYIKKC